MSDGMIMRRYGPRQASNGNASGSVQIGEYDFGLIVHMSQPATGAMTLAYNQFNNLSNYYAKADSIEAYNAMTIGSMKSGTSGYSNISYLYAPQATSIGSNACSGMSTLKIVDLPNCSTVQSGCFLDCTQLSSVNISKASQMQNATFSNCLNLQSISIPNCISIRAYVFQNCSNLSNAYIPNCQGIYAYAFNNCTKLSNLSAPNCNVIGAYAFTNCSDLSKITVGSKCSLSSANAFEGTQLSKPGGLIRIASEYSNNYASASLSNSPWHAYSNNFVYY